MRIESFESWSRLNEEALNSEITSAAQKAEMIAADPAKLGSVLKCIEGKPALKEAALLGTRAVVFSILMGLSGYLTVQSGGLTYPFISALTGYGAGLDLDKLSQLDWKEIDREVKACENCLRKHL